MCPVVDWGTLCSQDSFSFSRTLFHASGSCIQPVVLLHVRTCSHFRGSAGLSVVGLLVDVLSSLHGFFFFYLTLTFGLTPPLLTHLCLECASGVGFFLFTAYNLTGEGEEVNVAPSTPVR